MKFLIKCMNPNSTITISNIQFILFDFIDVDRSSRIEIGSTKVHDGQNTAFWYPSIMKYKYIWYITFKERDGIRRNAKCV